VEELRTVSDLDRALVDSKSPLILYKHSTRCGLCNGAMAEVEAFQAKAPAAATVLYLDLLAHRGVSNAIAKRLGVKHESPQAIVLKEGKVAAVLNHRAIRVAALEKAMAP
jgi:bacillithiol system protein YtxJ